VEIVSQAFRPALEIDGMHSDHGDVQASVRKYFMIGAALLIFTGITVAANLVHLAIPLAITVALAIAITKASMVAAVFMHLNHEKKWIYFALVLTVLFFFVLMTVPSFTNMDHIGTREPAIGGGEHPAGH
jgi:caa(3)-type oxidase subunit IV